MDPATAIICKCYGKPSPDGDLRLYTKEECTLLGGEWYPNGECIKPEGGSFSYDCRFLNTETCSDTKPTAPAPKPKIQPKIYKIKLIRKDGTVETVTATSVEVIETTKNTSVFKV